MGRIALLLSAVLISATAFGQDSKVILDKLSNKAKGYSTIDAQFTQRIVDKQSGIDQTQKGSIQLKGEKYKAVLGNYEIYSDGESLTTYDKELNEAMIDYLEDVVVSHSVQVRLGLSPCIGEGRSELSYWSCSVVQETDLDCGCLWLYNWSYEHRVRGSHVVRSNLVDHRVCHICIEADYVVVSVVTLEGRVKRVCAYLQLP